jgi:hypothetical protein
MKNNKFLGLRYDLWLHAMAGYILMLTGLIFTDFIIAAVITFYIAWIKEWTDEYYRVSFFDYADMYWTLMGGALAYGVFILAGQFGVL